jgi:hypothetical protein
MFLGHTVPPFGLRDGAVLHSRLRTEEGIEREEQVGVRRKIAISTVKFVTIFRMPCSTLELSF